MKILHICREKNNGDVGGIEHHVRYIAVEQQKMGLNPSILSFTLGNEESIIVKNKSNIEYIYLTLKKGAFTKLILQTANVFSKTGIVTAFFERIIQNFLLKEKIKIVDQINPDLIHQHDYLSSIRFSTRLAKNYKIIFTNHSGEYLFLKKTIITNSMQRSFLQNFDAVIASSKELLPEMKNCYQIFNGVDTSVFPIISASRKAERKKELNIDDKISILCARRWAPTKGVLDLAQALNLLDKEVQKKIVLLVAGNDSEDFKKYKLLVKAELDSCENIEFRYFGNISHNKLSDIMVASDIGVIPSIMEGISLFSIELIASGIPILATDVGGIPEIVKQNKNGWLVPPANPAKIAEEITRIVENWPDSNLNIEIEQFRETFSWATIAQQTVEIYKNIYVNENISCNRNKTRGAKNNSFSFKT